MAQSLAAYSNIIDPDVVVFVGSVSNIQRFYHNIPQILPEFIFGGEYQTPMGQAVHGDSRGVRGAAWLWSVGDQS
ncbi:ROK family protein [Vibrio gazogenes]|uniref:ROK family protein n=1 Tax=Vibrio gazogenes TaxID=687 RepID=UPI0013F4C400|nr:ROK family protein [Vibrio gazogenes]USP15897.1 ROK family protein [Vibrio gazogenes]